ncbi:TPA: hypothetical protein N0F65_005382 [Lagenidium giganteum]|uniref:DDE Tnp4 domain-containing protein n=1 Tax=Lagenidium giganteum TaxID=4803 RepID=A0AAV2YZC6_9STRA|nr:TPA: hypothetical protein N0F65_005382 [Lagenidium giganteum]
MPLWTVVHPSCIGFIDGTVRAICRPSRQQRFVYNGQKRKHALKYQSVITPDGIIRHLHGSVPGSRHDAYLLSLSKLADEVSGLLDGGEVQYVIYGDPAYARQSFLLSPFQGSALTTRQQAFNKKMSSVRVSVEWVFGDVLRYWAFTDYHKNQKLHLQAVGNIYHIAVVLTNVMTCLHGSQTRRYFRLSPPSLRAYLHE